MHYSNLFSINSLSINTLLFYRALKSELIDNQRITTFSFFVFSVTIFLIIFTQN